MERSAHVDYESSIPSRRPQAGLGEILTLKSFGVSRLQANNSERKANMLWFAIAVAVGFFETETLPAAVIKFRRPILIAPPICELRAKAVAVAAGNTAVTLFV